jgi:hypothetical protein
LQGLVGVTVKTALGQLIILIIFGVTTLLPDM